VPLAVVGILDLLAKRAIVASFVLNERRTIVPQFLDLTYVENTHGAMGLFGDRPAVLIALATIVLVTLGFVLRGALRQSSLAQIGFGAIAGGALGNVIDRVTHGYVIDYIAFPHFYIFNIADAAIAAGAALVALPSLVRAR
jgi:signal peptidase II